MFDSPEPRWGTEKRSLRSLRYRNGISKISGEILSTVTQGKQRYAIFVTQNIPLAIIVLSIGDAYTRISRERGPTHPYLCDVKASFDLFINLGLNWLRHIVNMLWTQVCRFETENKQF